MRRHGRIPNDSVALVRNGWNGWTYKRDRFHPSHRGSRAHHHRARPRGCRFAGCDSETPPHHTRWLLENGVRRGVEKETEKMQHEVMVLCRHTTCFSGKHDWMCTWRREWVRRASIRITCSNGFGDEVYLLAKLLSSVRRLEWTRDKAKIFLSGFLLQTVLEVEATRSFPQKRLGPGIGNVTATLL